MVKLKNNAPNNRIGGSMLLDEKSGMWVKLNSKDTIKSGTGGQLNIVSAGILA